MAKAGKEMSALSDFDLDLTYGHEGETLVNELLTGGKTVEVKRDRKWQITGNIYIECFCYFQGTQSWEESGLLTSKASYWAFVLNSMVLLISYDDLVKAVGQYGTQTECKLEPNRSKGFLITAENLIKVVKEKQ
jgi:hypothetical protein